MVESIQLTRQIAVKAIVTENFKVQVGGELSRNLQQLDAELQQLEFKGKRTIADLEKKATSDPTAQAQIESITNQMSTERARLTQLKNEMQEQSKVLTELPIGSVVTQFTLESAANVQVGQNIFECLEGGEILIKDGIIQEIKI